MSLRNLVFSALIALGLSFSSDIALASEPSAIVTTLVVVDTTQPGDYMSHDRTDTVFVRYDLGLVETVGNHSYIPINKYGTPAGWRKLILGLLCEFESVRVDLRVTNWKIEKQQYTRDASEKVFGLWIDHEPNNVDRSDLGRKSTGPGAKF